MSTKQVRSTESWPSYVLVVSGMFHREKGRKCEKCNAVWTVEFAPDGEPAVRRNGEEAQASILDWWGNNVAVQCCRVGQS